VAPASPSASNDSCAPAPFVACGEEGKKLITIRGEEKRDKPLQEREPKNVHRFMSTEGRKMSRLQLLWGEEKGAVAGTLQRGKERPFYFILPFDPENGRSASHLSYQRKEKKGVARS